MAIVPCKQSVTVVGARRSERAIANDSGDRKWNEDGISLATADHLLFILKPNRKQFEFIRTNAKYSFSIRSFDGKQTFLISVFHLREKTENDLFGKAFSEGICIAFARCRRNFYHYVLISAEKKANDGVHECAGRMLEHFESHT